MPRLLCSLFLYNTFHGMVYDIRIEHITFFHTFSPFLDRYLDPGHKAGSSPHQHYGARLQVYRDKSPPFPSVVD